MAGPRWVTPEPLNVAPRLVGLPLATPQRRAAAMAVDLAVVALLSGVSGFWLVGGLVMVVLQLRSQRGGTRWRTLVGWGFAGLLGLLALQEAWDTWGPDRAVHQAAARAEAAANKAEAVAEAAANQSEVAAERAPAAARPASAAGPDAEQRIAQLEAEVAALRKPQPLNLRHELDRAIDAAGASFGWGIVYFSLLPAWWGGQTPGKKLFGLRVVELTGQPMTVMRCLRRYGGYAAGMATGGLGFVQLLWDHNRQGIQDRTAHTVVIDLRAPPSVAVAESA
jgi:hypothetical protein